MFQNMIGNGAIAQLGERLHGMQEVSGSIPLGSTKKSKNIYYVDQCLEEDMLCISPYSDQ